MTDICLVGATALTALLAAMICGRWLLRGAAAVRSYLLAFLVFAAVAMNFAQKRGMGIENGELRMENGGGVAAGDSTILHSPLYILHSVTTNETYSYVMPTNGTRYEKWWRRGERECRMENVEWRMCA